MPKENAIMKQLVLSVCADCSALAERLNAKPWQLTPTRSCPGGLFLPDPVLSSVVSAGGTSVNRQAGQWNPCDSALVQELPGLSKWGSAAQTGRQTGRKNTVWQLTAVEEHGSLAVTILYQKRGKKEATLATKCFLNQSHRTIKVGCSCKKNTFLTSSACFSLRLADPDILTLW